MVQVIACCLTAPSNYLNQYWPFVCVVLRRLLKDNFTGNVQDIILEMDLKNINVKLPQNFPGANELIWWETSDGSISDTISALSNVPLYKIMYVILQQAYFHLLTRNVSDVIDLCQLWSRSCFFAWLTLNQRMNQW